MRERETEIFLYSVKKNPYKLNDKGQVTLSLVSQGLLGFIKRKMMDF